MKGGARPYIRGGKSGVISRCKPSGGKQDQMSVLTWEVILATKILIRDHYLATFYNFYKYIWVKNFNRRGRGRLLGTEDY